MDRLDNGDLRHAPVGDEGQESRIVHELHAAMSRGLQPQDQDSRVRRERQVAKQRGNEVPAGLALGRQHVVVAVHDVADGTDRAKRHESRVGRNARKAELSFQPKDSIDLASRVEDEVAREDRQQGLLPEVRAERVDGSDDVNAADEQDALNGAGEGREVQRAGVVLLPTANVSSVPTSSWLDDSRRGVEVAERGGLASDGPPRPAESERVRSENHLELSNQRVREVALAYILTVVLIASALGSATTSLRSPTKH